MDWLLTNTKSLFECLGFEKKDNPSQWMKKTELLFLIQYLWF